MTTALPVRFITEARWIAEMLAGTTSPGRRVLYVRNGIAKDVFRSPTGVPRRWRARPLRVVLEGCARRRCRRASTEALSAVGADARAGPRDLGLPARDRRRPTAVDSVLSGLTHAEMAALFADHHVMLKLSRAEGMYGPPLEAFHMGATVVTTPVTGHDEYVAPRRQRARRRMGRRPRHGSGARPPGA